MSILKTLINRAQRFYQGRWGFTAFLFAAGFLTYLYPLTQLGYFWDDWEVVYLTRLATPSILEGYFFFDRPLAWPYPIFAALLGAQPFFWHLLTLLLRWAGTLFFYQALLFLWPRQRPALQWTAILMLVFPAFLQQSIATAFSRHFTAYLLCSLSFYFTALALRTRHKSLFWLLAWLTGALQIFSIEYFAGLELVRPVFIWLLLGPAPFRQKLKQTALLWLPFLAVFLVFGWWRVAYYPTLLTTQKFASRARFVTNLAQNPLQAVADLLVTVWLDLSYMLSQSWLSLATNAEKLDLLASSFWFALVSGGILSLLFNLFNKPTDDQPDNFGKQALWLGLAGLLAGGLPVWTIGRRASGSGVFDNRFAIGMLLGSALLIIGLVWVLIQPRWRNWVLTIMLALGIFGQMIVVNTYRREWSNMLDYFWQMSWRAPALKPDTAVLGGYIPSLMLPDYDASFSLALLYSGQKTGTHLPYWYFTWEDITNNNVKPKDGGVANVNFRNLQFQGTIGKSVMILHQTAPGCLRVADAFYTGDPAIGSQTAFLPYSNLAQIENKSDHAPDPAIFGAEPPHAWCYYYEKADLARQFGQWDQVLQLYKQAASRGYASQQGAEYLPQFEAFARSGQWQNAYQLAKKIVQLTPELTPNLCAKWAGYASLPAADASLAAKARADLACP